MHIFCCPHCTSVNIFKYSWWTTELVSHRYVCPFCALSVFHSYLYITITWFLNAEKLIYCQTREERNILQGYQRSDPKTQQTQGMSILLIQLLSIHPIFVALLHPYLHLNYKLTCDHFFEDILASHFLYITLTICRYFYNIFVWLCASTHYCTPHFRLFNHHCPWLSPELISFPSRHCLIFLCPSWDISLIFHVHSTDSSAL